ncbi:hypothetical protein [Williamsia muralis]|uniref:hypothetical protein n=1 Tax=Williamsia marianensis TaxID=85044 RepID=UPI003830E4A3
MPSPQFADLSKRITALRRSLLPSSFSPTGSYAPRLHERAKAFRLLAHAEFESYLESIVLDLVQERVNAWISSGKLSITLAALLAYADSEPAKMTSLLTPPQKVSPALNDRIIAARNSFNSLVRTQNHGIREMNVLKLVLPTGLDPASLDMTWLASLDSWAKDRGDIAHNTHTRVRALIDPGKELRDARMILNGFKKLDGQLKMIP